MNSDISGKLEIVFVLDLLGENNKAYQLLLQIEEDIYKKILVENKKVDTSDVLSIYSSYSSWGKYDCALRISKVIEILNSNPKGLIENIHLSISKFQIYKNLIALGGKELKKAMLCREKYFNELKNSSPDNTYYSKGFDTVIYVGLYNRAIKLCNEIISDENTSVLCHYFTLLSKSRQYDLLLTEYSKYLQLYPLEKETEETWRFHSYIEEFSLYDPYYELGLTDKIFKEFMLKYTNNETQKLDFKKARSEVRRLLELSYRDITIEPIVYALAEKDRFELIGSIFDITKFKNASFKYDVLKALIKLDMYWHDDKKLAKKKLKLLRKVYPLDFDTEKWIYRYYLHFGEIEKAYKTLFSKWSQSDYTQRDNALTGDLCLYYMNFDLTKTKYIDLILRFSDYLIDERIFMARIAMLAPTKPEEAKKFFATYKDRVAKMPLGELALAVGKYLTGQGSEKEVFSVKTKTKCQKNRKAVYANFYIGQNYYQAGDQKKAKKYLKKVLRQRYLGFHIVGIARYILKKSK